MERVDRKNIMEYHIFMADRIEQDDIRKYTHENKPTIEQARDIGAAIDEANQRNEVSREQRFNTTVDDISREVARKVAGGTTTYH